MCRSREGAWIEICNINLIMQRYQEVAPARERGLKFFLEPYAAPPHRRSREGAWIEIVLLNMSFSAFPVAPARERGLKSYINRIKLLRAIVAPARERGLKCAEPQGWHAPLWSLPRGSVD